MSKTSILGGVVRKFLFIALLLVTPHSFAFAPNAPVQNPFNAPAQNPVDAFLKTQNDKTDPVLNAQISELMQAGYTKRGDTGAVSLGGGCGVVGCNSTCLVTTEYSTPGVNPRSRIVAAIVTIINGKEFRVRRILTSGCIEGLFKPK